MSIVVPFPIGMTPHQKYELMNNITAATVFKEVHHNDFEEFEASLLCYPHMYLCDEFLSALSRREYWDMSFNDFRKRYYKNIYLGGE